MSPEGYPAADPPPAIGAKSVPSITQPPPPTWLRNRILITLRRDVGRTISDLAVLTGATVADTKRVCWRLIQSGQADWCAGYVTSMPVRRAR